MLYVGRLLYIIYFSVIIFWMISMNFMYIKVEGLQEYHVLSVACGSGDSQTLCVTYAGTTAAASAPETRSTLVWSWGDGDYGKLGRGGSDGYGYLDFLVNHISWSLIL